MECFYLELKEENQELKSLISFCEEGQWVNVVFRRVKEKFADSVVEGNREDQPFLYMKIVPVREANSRVAASFIPTVCFKIEVKEEVLEFIKSKNATRNF